MSLKHLKIDSDIEDTNTDVLPGSGFTLDTGLYEMVIDVGFMDTSDSGAEALKLHLKMTDGSPQTLRTAFWVASGTKKGKKTFYVTKDGKKRSLPGFVQASQVAEICATKALADLTEEEKTIKLWNSTSQAEENTQIRYLPDLKDKPILVGVLKVRDNKVALSGTIYEKQPEERFFNEVDKVFHPNGLSITEKNAGAKTPDFRDRWAARYGSETVDRYEQVANSQPDLPSHTSTEGTPVSSLFSSDDE